mgnify:FL=1
MPRIVGVIFQKGGRIYDFDAGSLELVHGDQVVVETVRGLEMGEVIVGPAEREEGEQSQPLKPVLRRAGSQDLETVAAAREVRKEALATCRELIATHGLDMKLVDAEVMFGGGKIVFSFYADERVDFRALVVDLAKALHMRIELRQIGVRDEARLFGGLGPCGRHLCCTLFQMDQEPVSIRMAKEQNLPLNPMKISGLCGRLMCCLKYEQEQYVAFRRDAPRRGTPVRTPRGDGVVAGYQVPKDSLVVKLPDGTTVEEKARQVRLVDAEGRCIGTAISIDAEGVVTEVPAGMEGPRGAACGAGVAEEPGGDLQPCPGCPLAVPDDFGALSEADAAEAAAGAPAGAGGTEPVSRAGQRSVRAGSRAGTGGGSRPEAESGQRRASRKRGQVPSAEGSEEVGGREHLDNSSRAQECTAAAAAAEGETEAQPGDTEPGEEGTGSVEARKRRPRRRRRRPRGQGGVAGTEAP